ncbi:hypothetical protein KCP71_15855 [Salmonella enterica subsp. enterica]|nr:hypothetical protein KCP71_15855 [Salmonella enterica subsp. enterica]
MFGKNSYHRSVADCRRRLCWRIRNSTPNKRQVPDGGVMPSEPPSV